MDAFDAGCLLGMTSVMIGGLFVPITPSVLGFAIVFYIIVRMIEITFRRRGDKQ